MSDFSTPPPSGAFPAPAEGLPPCLKMVAVFEDRQATWHLREPCPNPDNRASASRNFVCAGQRGGIVPPYHRNIGIELLFQPPVLEMLTDDPAEAQAAFERGAEWVRTGMGP